MSIINERYNKVVCINLKERPDKKQYMMGQFSQYDIDVEWYHPVILNYATHFVEPYADKHNDYSRNYVRFNKHFPNEFGTLHSHYYVIKSALLDGAQSLFVFEDDCAFHEDWDELLPKYLNTIPENAEGVLFYSFMHQLEPQNVRVKPRWTKGFASWSLLAYGMTRSMMETYIAYVDATPMIADRVTWELMTRQNANIYVASPPLVIPAKDLTSNIRGENKNYEKVPNVFLLGIDQTKYK